MTSDRGSVLDRLIDRIRTGDQTAIGELIVAAQQRLRALAARILNVEFRGLKDRGECDTIELTQELSCRLLTALRAAPPNDVSHLMRLAAQQIKWYLLDQTGHPHPRPAESLSSVPQVDSSTCNNSSPVSESGPRPPSQGQVEIALAQLLRDLPEPFDEIIDLKLIWGFTHEEIARQIGASTKAVQRRWDKALVTLYDGLVKAFPELDQPKIEGGPLCP